MTGVSGVNVKVGNKTATTDANGFYMIEGLVENKVYVAEFTKSGYEYAETTGVEVYNGKITSLNVRDYDNLKKTSKAIEVKGKVFDKVTGAVLNGTSASGTTKVELQVFDKHINEWITVETDAVLTGGVYTFTNATLNPKSNDATDSSLLEYGGKYKLVVSEVGYKEKTVDFTVDENKKITEVAAIELDPIKELDATIVVKRDGNPTAGSKVTIVDELSNSVVTAAETTDVNGKAEFKDLQLETGKYFVKVETVQSTPVTVKTVPVTVTEDKDFTASVELAQGAQIEFDLKAPAGKTFANGDVIANVYDANGIKIATQTILATNVKTKDALKFDTFENFESSAVAVVLPAGTYKIEVSGDYVVTKEYSITITPAQVAAFVDVTATVVKNLGGIAELAGKIVEENVNKSIEIEGSTIYTTGSNYVIDSTKSMAVVFNSAGKEVKRVQLPTDKTLEDIGGLAAGEYSIKIFKPGYVFNEKDSTFKYTIKVNEDTKIADKALKLKVDEVAATASGIVRKSDLTPFGLSEATVSYYNSNNKLVDAIETNLSGEYEINSLTPGVYTVVVRSNAKNTDKKATSTEVENYETYKTEVTIKSGDNLENVNYTLAKGETAKIEFSLVDENNKAFTDASSTITLWDANADQSKVASAEAGAFTATYNHSPADESITFENLSAGDYVIEIVKAGFAKETRAIKLEKSDNYRLVYELSSNAFQYDISVKVTDEKAATPTKDAQVIAMDTNGSIVAKALTDSSGDATLKLTNGTYTVMALDNGKIAQTKTVVVNKKDVVVPTFQLTVK